MKLSDIEVRLAARNITVGKLKVKEEIQVWLKFQAFNASMN
jgi:hypothetical protein